MLELNRSDNFGKPISPIDREALGADAAFKVEKIFRSHPHHGATPLHSLQNLAKSLGVESIEVKDEGGRLGQGSFKALGGGYALIRLTLDAMSQKFNRHISVDDLHDPDIRTLVQDMTFGCATDGNHGYSVAAAARELGASAKVFVHENVDRPRVEAIANLGADVIRVKGNYDDAVAEAKTACLREGWVLVSDTSWPGYEVIPRLVMQGYTVIASEILSQLSHPPSHVFLQAGVGGFAASVAANIDLTLASKRPKFIIVEPERAACLFESNAANTPIKVSADQPTVMAMLECYEPSFLAWEILSRLADAYMTVQEAEAISAVRILGSPKGDDSSIVSRESGAAGLAGLIAALQSPEARQLAGLGPTSRVLIINTEGLLPERR